MVPRPAASVIVLRERAGGRAAGRANGAAEVELFCVRRHQGSPFLGGALVFPGGKVDATDSDAAWAELASAPRPTHEGFLTEEAATEVDARALAIAACRELLEEAEIIPTTPGIDAKGAEELRAAMVGGASLGTELARRGLTLALDALVPWARWITPAAEARRFDARFYLLALPAGQLGRCDERETTEGFWSTPREVLARWERGELFLAPPTARTLELLASVKTIGEALALAARQSLRPICPTFVPGDPPALALPGDPAHDVRERRVEGPTRFVLRDGRFVGEESPWA